MKKLNFFVALTLIVAIGVIFYFFLWLALVVAIAACIDLIITKKPWKRVYCKK